ncbi:MAG: adenine-specific methyltransferase EcoRI family protein [Pseudomonadota bacterium]
MTVINSPAPEKSGAVLLISKPPGMILKLIRNKRLAPSASGNSVLSNAKKAKQDEFYTQLTDISAELKHYKKQLRGKTIFCNCDDPYESNFFKYFALNFNALGLKKLIATSYKASPIVGAQLPLFDIEGLKPEGREPYAIEINEVPDQKKKGTIDITDVEYLLKHDANTVRALMGDNEYSAGDFRSRECVKLLKQADVIVTNPPFSLFREFVTQLVEHDKKFLIIGNTNAITYKEIFSLIKENKFRTGNTNFNVGMFFEVPDDWEKYHHIDEKTGRKIARVSTSCWYTNMDVKKHHDFLPLYKKYTASEYPKYDNYEAIEVSKVAEIPVDYDGTIGVPITFIDKYNPEQFEILGITKTWFGDASKIYPNQTQVSKDGKKSTVSKLNDGATLKLKKPPTDQTYYVVDGNYYIQLYARVLVKRKT